MKKILLVFVLLFMVVGCADDPFTAHNKDVIKTIYDAKDTKNQQEAEGFIQAIQKSYSDYMSFNSEYPTIQDLNIEYQTNACNLDPNSENYALRVEDGYLHIYCEGASYDQNTMKMQTEY